MRDDTYAGAVASREDIGSWLEGSTPGQRGGRGARLGLPPSGSGSLAGLGRRAAALVVDWVACLLISGAFFPSGERSLSTLTQGDPMVTLAIFAVENIVLVGSIGCTLGQRLLGLRVRRVVVPPPGQTAAAEAVVRAPGFLSSLVRTLLLCLVVPAVVWDADGRGLHDRAAGTAIVRR